MISLLLGALVLSPPTGEAPAPKTVGQVMSEAPASAWVTPDPDDLLYVETAQGQIIVRLSRHLAPGHVAQVKTLAREGYYDGLHFYRVIEGFVAQAGDAKGDRDKGSALDPIPAEFEEPMTSSVPFTPLGFDDGYADQAGYIDGMPAGIDKDDGSVWLAHCTGAFAFGRENERDSASTEFYIPVQPQRYLDRNLTVFGRVLLGMDVVQAIPRGELNNGGTIKDEDRWTEILSVRVGSDVPQEDQVAVQYFDTSSDSFKDLITARSSRASEFFHYRHGYMDLCQLPLPVRMTPANDG